MYTNEFLENVPKEYKNLINDLLQNETVIKMKNFRQHYTTSCLDHCLKVSYYNFLLCKKLNLDYISATRAGLLHDLFLYDWRLPSTEHQKWHAFKHPYIAYKNACKVINLNKKEKDIILKHMWPITIRPPRYAESFITTIVDKYCTLEECVVYYKEKIYNKIPFIS